MGYAKNIVMGVTIGLVIFGHCLASYLYYLSFTTGLTVINKVCIISHEFSRPLHVFLLIVGVPLIPNVCLAMGIIFFFLFHHPFCFWYDTVMGILEIINGIVFIMLLLWCGEGTVSTWATLRDAATPTIAGGIIHLQMAVLEYYLAEKNMAWQKRAAAAAYVPVAMFLWFTMCCRKKRKQPAAEPKLSSINDESQNTE